MIAFATDNAGKYRTVAGFLEQAGVAVRQAPMSLPEPRSLDVAEIARAKAAHAFSVLGSPCLAVDSAFFIPALGGFPATYVNFVLTTIGLSGILALAGGRELPCEFRNCLAYVDSALPEPKVFSSPVPGRLAPSPRGECPPWAWSELYRVFIPAGRSRTLAQMSRENYLKWTEDLHRDSFVSAFSAWLKTRKGKEA